MELRRTANGALAGALAAAVWAAQQPLDKRAFGTPYDDVELLGKLVTRGQGWPAAGLALHMANGAAFGAVYSLVRPLIPAPPVLTGVTAGLAEHVGLWPLVRAVDRHHPARQELVPLSGNGRAFAQAAWRHLLFGGVLGELERRLNADSGFEPLEDIPASSNGHGNIEQAAVGATEES
jgi:XapX domain-containing protein